MTLDELSRMECSVRWWGTMLVRQLAQHGHRMRAAELLLLARMPDRAIPAHEIAENAYFATNASYTLKALVAAGYLAGRWGEAARNEDRRERLYSLTDSGRTVRALVASELAARVAA